jgi:hypothetical protein
MGEEENEERVYISSIPSRRTIPRDRYSGYVRLMEDYFVANPVYGENLFHRRFVDPNYLTFSCQSPSLAHDFGYVFLQVSNETGNV